jgi:hypothetical protein
MPVSLLACHLGTPHGTGAPPSSLQLGFASLPDGATLELASGVAHFRANSQLASGCPPAPSRTAMAGLLSM